MKGDSKDFLLGVIETIMNDGYKDIVLKIYNKGNDFVQTTIEMKGNRIANLYTLARPLNKITEELIKLYKLKEAYELIGKPYSDIQHRIKNLEEKFGKGVEKIISEAINKDYPFECYNGQKIEGPLKYELKPKNIINICHALYETVAEKEVDIKLDKAFSF